MTSLASGSSLSSGSAAAAASFFHHGGVLPSLEEVQPSIPSIETATARSERLRRERQHQQRRQQEWSCAVDGDWTNVSRANNIGSTNVAGEVVEENHEQTTRATSTKDIGATIEHQQQQDQVRLETTRSAMLQLLGEARFPFPYVRKLALKESAKAAKSIEGLHDLVRENITNSPYIPEQVKPQLIHAILTQNWIVARSLITSRDAAKRRGTWKGVKKNPGTTVASSPNPIQSAYWKLSTSIKTRRVMAALKNDNATSTGSEEYKEFRQMAIAIFASSKKIRKKSDRRGKLGRLIQKTNNHEDAVQFLLDVLEDSQALNEVERARVAGDVLDGRYDRLLLKDRLDCELSDRLDYNDPTVLSEESFAALSYDSGSSNSNHNKNNILSSSTAATSGRRVSARSTGTMMKCDFCWDFFNSAEDCVVTRGSTVASSSQTRRTRICRQHELCKFCLDAALSQNGRYPPCPICGEETGAAGHNTSTTFLMLQSGGSNELTLSGHTTAAAAAVHHNNSSSLEFGRSDHTFETGRPLYMQQQHPPPSAATLPAAIPSALPAATQDALLQLLLTNPRQQQYHPQQQQASSLLRESAARYYDDDGRLGLERFVNHLCSSIVDDDDDDDDNYNTLRSDLVHALQANDWHRACGLVSEWNAAAARRGGNPPATLVSSLSLSSPHSDEPIRPRPIPSEVMVVVEPSQHQHEELEQQEQQQWQQQELSLQDHFATEETAATVAASSFSAAEASITFLTAPQDAAASITTAERLQLELYEEDFDLADDESFEA
mmetsp:Transcript_47220/g.70261  ORF Transcript_47220/g.70261 Transcript_47220/m.70261 type:complete len:778 (-) Transcript_47220:1258-3591(-)|eukprot:CAMPEP_0194044964 /NCGR_PEP_ID=MMETSP0009_2-20130614/16353_1 /TAXON_ID=210454 /ORGANISM="Grammatophora oceanica, Strain CCMP 410" /LENGTH=777 /DNA_ID=CAMNT_0038689663 /DNA_START=103 /DNA_END=2436 /DNA_ORIENTATION=+